MIPPDREPAPPGRELEAEVAALEEKAEESALSYRARYLNRAGDLCASHGQPERALHYWGRAIDAYLQIARETAAAATCRKAIDRVPTVVRARCTLALLSVGRGSAGEAIEHIDDYVQAARRAGRTHLAVHQLRLIGRATSDEKIRSHVARCLAELQDAPARSGAEGEAALGDPLEEADRWPTLLLAAHMSPQDIEEA